MRTFYLLHLYGEDELETDQGQIAGERFLSGLSNEK